MDINTARAELENLMDVHKDRVFVPVNREILKGVIGILNNAEEKKPVVKTTAKKTTTRSKKPTTSAKKPTTKKA